MHKSLTRVDALMSPPKPYTLLPVPFLLFAVLEVTDEGAAKAGEKEIGGDWVLGLGLLGVFVLRFRFVFRCMMSVGVDGRT